MENVLDTSMDNNDTKAESTELAAAIKRYEDALHVVEKNKARSDKSQILALLVARDELENLFTLKEKPDDKEFSQLFTIDQQVVELDIRLRRLEDVIASTISIDKWKLRLNRDDEKHWWWQFEPPRHVDTWDRLDWLWDMLTLGTLAVAASFMVSIISALSVGSLTVASTLSTIAQVGGLAIVSQGALTENGQQKVRDFMNRFRIPSRFQSEFMLLLALLLLGTVYGTHMSLNDLYLEDGREAYQQGDLGDAETIFMRGLEIEPDNSTYNAELGRIYESLGALDKAIEQYYYNAQSGGVKGINDLGRAYINWVNPATKNNDPSLAEAYLLLALQRANTQDPPNNDLLYQVNRNLGWTLLKQKKYDAAERYLKTAITLDESITMNQIGGGMAYCFLGMVYEQQGKLAQARSNWSNCVQKARPETIHEYRWFSEVNKNDIAACINTSKIVSGLDETQFEDKFRADCSVLITASYPLAEARVAARE